MPLQPRGRTVVLLAALLLLEVAAVIAQDSCNPLDDQSDCYQACDPAANNVGLVPTSFVVYQASQGDTFSAGQTMIILAKWPDTVCVPPPQPITNPGCTAALELKISKGSVTVQVEPSVDAVEQAYSVSFRDEPGLYSDPDKDPSVISQYLTPWVWILNVDLGMNAVGLDANSINISAECNNMSTASQFISGVGEVPFQTSFNTTGKQSYAKKAISPTGLNIDTMAPGIVSVSTAERTGNFTAGHMVDIVVTFSKDVFISALPDIYSQVYLDAQATGRMLYGVPYIELNTKTYVALRGYENTKDFSMLSFLYVVGTGEETPDGKFLDVENGTTIQLNGGSIYGRVNGIDADLTTMPFYGTPGSLTDKGRPKLTVFRTGVKFPPFKYDPTLSPDTSVTTSVRRNGQIESSRRILQPTLVKVDFQLGSVYNLVEKNQQFSSDFQLIVTWTDLRLKNPKAKRVETKPASALATIWNPDLTFGNRRDTSNPIEGVLTIVNDGTVTLQQRYLSSYSIAMDMRDFPFDTQVFRWNMRSFSKNMSTVRFVVADDQAKKTNSDLLGRIIDPTFWFGDYNQDTFQIVGGIFANFELLSISILAQRIPTMSAIFLIFPLCMLCLALALTLQNETGNASRLSVPLTVMTGTMAFSYVIANQTPPVSYTTRMHLLIFQNYIFAVLTLLINYFLWCIDWAKKEFGKGDDNNKKLLDDAEKLAKKIKKSKPSKTIIVEGGIYPEGYKVPMDKVAPKPENPPPMPTGAVMSTSSSESPPSEVLSSGGPEPVPRPDVVVSITVGSNKVAPEEAKPDAQVDKAEKKDEKPKAEKKPKTAEDGAFPDGEGGFVDVKDLLESEEVKIFQKMKFGGKEVKFFYGTCHMNIKTKKSFWDPLVSWIDFLLKHIVPALMCISIGCILGVNPLSGLGAAEMPYLGKPLDGTGMDAPAME